MAKKTFTNQGGQVSITFANGRRPIFVPAGGSYSTDDAEEQTALRKAGFRSGGSVEKKNYFDKKEKS